MSFKGKTSFGGLYGDGSDGDVTLTSGNTILSRDMYYNTLEVQSGATMETRGYRIFVKGLCTIDGSLNNVGADGDNTDSGSRASGAGGWAGTLGGGADGRNGATGIVPGSFPIQQALGSGGGEGGDGVKAGGTGAGAQFAVSQGGVQIQNAFPWATLTTAINVRSTSGLKKGGGGGGGAGGDNSTKEGGDGGGGGGLIMVVARTFAGTGTFEAYGGDGDNGQSGGGNTGGGGGGGGGAVILIGESGDTSGFTFDVSGGAFGTGSGGSNGKAGTIGKTYIALENDLEF